MCEEAGEKYYAMSYEQAAAELVEVGQRLLSAGLVAGNDGNISVRLSRDEVLVTPTGVSKGELTAERLVLVNVRGEVLEGSLKPTSELGVHLQVYRNNPTLRAVIHAHAPYATAFALAGRTLSGCRLAEVTECLGEIPLVPYAKPGSVELALGVGERAAAYRGVFMEAHGPVTWGENLRQALYRMEELELACKITWLAQLLGK
jgi:L-fuculose-phosphate aldolase